MSRTPWIQAALIGCLAATAAGCGGSKAAGREQAAFVRRVESACAARASAARRLPAPRTRSALLASFPTRRFVEADFAASVGRISPPRTGEQSFRRLTHAADTRVEAADDLNDAVVRRDVPEARAALSVSRSASIVIEREARALGARCAS